MKRGRRVAIIILLVLVLILGFILPTLVVRVQDMRMDQTQERMAATSVQLDMASSLTVLQKMRLVAEADAPVALDTAQNMDEEQALTVLMDGLQTIMEFDTGDILPSVNGFSEVSHTIRLQMSDDQSLIYWEFWLADGDGNQIGVMVDDDTGIILSLHYTISIPDPQEEGPDPPTPPLFVSGEIPEGSVSVFDANGIHGALEEADSSAEELAMALQEQYCVTYLRGMGCRLEQETDSAEAADNSYQYTVMLTDDEGGYYVMPFAVSNTEVDVN